MGLATVQTFHKLLWHVGDRLSGSREDLEDPQPRRLAETKRLGRMPGADPLFFQLIGKAVDSRVPSAGAQLRSAQFYKGFTAETTPEEKDSRNIFA